MRFKARKRGNIWFVVDTETGAIMGRHNSEDRANIHARKLNQNPPPNPPAKRVWDIQQTGQSDVLNDLLDEGWEPYAVDKGIHYLRKKVKQPQGGGGNDGNPGGARP